MIEATVIIPILTDGQVDPDVVEDFKAMLQQQLSHTLNRQLSPGEPRICEYARFKFDNPTVRVEGS